MNENRTRSNPQDKKQTFNGWKWSFISLVTIIVLALGVFMMSLRAVSVNEAHTEPIVEAAGEMAFSTAIEKADAERLINMFLESASEANNAAYSVELTDQLEINGTAEILTFDVPFTLSFDPYVLENGNIQLRADSIQVASFSLPVSAVMSLLTNQLLIPDYLAIDSQTQMIVINLNEINTGSDIRVAMTKIDLENNELRLNLFVDESLLIENMNLETERMQ